VTSLPYLLDLAGTFVFAAANTGGITRDLLIGAVPPGAISDWHYVGVSVAAGLLTFCFPAEIMRRWSPVLWFDAAGLALFAVSGAHKALAHGLNPVMAVLLGMLTGIGGGMARDLLLVEIPIVLRAELYAVAALLGAAVVVTGSLLRLPSNPVTLVAVALCFSLRILAMRHGWHLPVAGTTRRGSVETPSADQKGGGRGSS
jgi:uncharacterized membrane protein YeiH